jgi:tight adherence protein B
MIVTPWAPVAFAATAVMLLVAFSIEMGVKALARHRAAATERVRLSMLELFLFLDPHLLYVSAAIFCLAVVLAVMMATHSPVAALLAGAGAALLPAAVIQLLRRRRRRMLQEQFPDALLMLSGALRAGSSLTTAMQQIGPELPAPVSQEIGLVLREQRLGVSLDAALEGFSSRACVPSVSLAVAAMRIAHDSGGGLAEALERAAATLRSQLAIESKIRALTSQGKLQALIVGALPLLLMVILLRMEPAEMSLLFVTRAGIAALMVIGILEVLGVYVIRRIVMIDV